MRVKIGDNWHEVRPDASICIELSAADRRNIANMVDGATKYAVFHDSDPRSSDQKIVWMD